MPAQQAGSSDAVLSQCISVVNYPGTNMDFYLRTSTLDAGVKLNWLLTQIFVGTGCNTSNNPFFLSDTTSSAGMPVLGAGGTWVQRGDVNSTAISIFPGTKFVLLRITMSNFNRPGLGGRYFVDHVEFGTTGTTSWPDTLFANGFN